MNTLSATKNYNISDSDEDSVLEYHTPYSSLEARPIDVPGDASDASSPSLEDSHTDTDGSDSDSDSDSAGPSLQMMGETHIRLKKSQGQLARRALNKSTRIRVASDPPQLAQSLPSEQVEIPFSPAMAFLAGFNSPLSTTNEINDASLITEERVGPYVLGPVFAHGGFSVIRKGTSPSGVVAVKVISRSAEEEKALENEISIWSSLHHEYILPLFNTYRTDDTICLVSLYCPAGSLFDILRLHGAPGLPHDDVGTMFRQIVRGLRYLHEQVGVVHGDIKLENVLIDELGACRIIDFGLSQYISDHGAEQSDDEPSHSALPPHLRGRPSHHRNSTHVPGVTAPLSLHHFPAGSLPYCAPELLLPPVALKDNQTPRSHQPHPAQDIWALGCLLHALLFGRLPFVDNFEARLQMKIVRGIWERGRSRTRSRAAARGSHSRNRMQSTSRDGRATNQFQGHVHHAPRRSPSNDIKIGKGARNVLRGCICVDVQKRWTIGQIDEVAWNIGWEDVEEIAQNNSIVEPQLETNGEPLTSTPYTRTELDARTPNQWETDAAEISSLPFQIRAPIRNRSRTRITTKL